MRKELVIPVVVIIMAAAVGMYWYYADRDDVRITGLDAPYRLGLQTPGQLSIIVQNNESVPVNVTIDVKNAFVGKNGTSLPTSRIIFTETPYSGDVFDYSALVPLTGEITLMPGENTIGVFLGYVVAGNHSVEVSIYQNEKLIDEAVRYLNGLGEFSVSIYQNERLIDVDTVIIEVPLPELSLQLGYEKATTDKFDFYRVDGYLTNHEISRVLEPVTISVTVTNDKTGEVVSIDTQSRYCEAVLMSSWDISHWNISNWEDSPMTLIELARNDSSNLSYMPVTSVVKGKIGDRYRVNVTHTSKYQVLSAEIVIPPA